MTDLQVLQNAPTMELYQQLLEFMGSDEFGDDDTEIGHTLQALVSAAVYIIVFGVNNGEISISEARTTFDDLHQDFNELLNKIANN
jgi:hypothetical protein